MIKRIKNQYVSDFCKEYPEPKRGSRRQDFEACFIRNGAIYATNTESLLKNKKLISDNKKAYIMPESKWLNIDTQRDILMAEVMLSEWIKGKL